VRIVKEDASEAEIDEVMRSGGTEQVLQSAILRTAADPVREAYERAQDKYRDVLRLEQSVMELNQMFADFALLTAQQGELLDQIEYNVTSAHEFVQDAIVDIEKAIDYQKSIRQKQCCIFITLVIIGIIIMGALGLFSGGGSSSSSSGSSSTP
jgi:t-SNARE complex subunit (syntaxin)